MILRARWSGHLPRPGEYLMSSSRPRYAYRLMDVEALKTLAHHPAGSKRLKLTCERIDAGLVPEGAVVHPWKWDARKKRGDGWSASV